MNAMGKWEAHEEELLMRQSGAKASAAVFMRAIEQCIEAAGTAEFSANSTEYVEVPGWYKRVAISYFGGGGTRHFQLLTLWGGEKGKTREWCIVRKLRDDVAKKVFPEEMRTRLAKARDDYWASMVSYGNAPQKKQQRTQCATA